MVQRFGTVQKHLDIPFNHKHQWSIMSIKVAGVRVRSQVFNVHNFNRTQRVMLLLGKLVKTYSRSHPESIRNDSQLSAYTVECSGYHQNMAKILVSCSHYTARPERSLQKQEKEFKLEAAKQRIGINDEELEYVRTLISWPLYIPSPNHTKGSV